MTAAIAVPLNTVFGVGNWDHLRFETALPATLFSNAYDFVYIDGSDSNALALNSFLTANHTLIEQFVHLSSTGLSALLADRPPHRCE